MNKEIFIKKWKEVQSNKWTLLISITILPIFIPFGIMGAKKGYDFVHAGMLFEVIPPTAYIWVIGTSVVGTIASISMLIRFMVAKNVSNKEKNVVIIASLMFIAVPLFLLISANMSAFEIRVYDGSTTDADYFSGTMVKWVDSDVLLTAILKSPNQTVPGAIFHNLIDYGIITESSAIM